jgi:AcrR family transcriptional regulator
VVVEALEHAPRERIDKFAERRAELAQAAVRTLSELGYARTSLREIAQNSEFSHGVLHYYFKDKVDLITCCVRQYKAQCIKRYDQITVEAQTYGELLEGFSAGLAATVRDEAHLHRLWYDLRAQALFEPAFRADVREIDKSLETMIWRIMSRLHEFAGAPQVASPPLLYALFDGLFQQCLLKHLSGDALAIVELQMNVRLLIGGILGLQKSAVAGALP